MPNELQQKKFLDANGLAYFSRKLNNYPTNDVIVAVVEGIQDALDEKVDTSSVGQANGVASLDANGIVPSNQLPATVNTTYTLSQSLSDGHTFTLTGTDGSSQSVTIPDNNTEYQTVTQSRDGLMSSQDKQKLDGIANNANIGTITEIRMNGASVGTIGSVDLGTVITSHQDISGKMDASLKGAPLGVAELDSTGKVPESQLPSYVDDVIEYANRDAFPLTGESGKIYMDIATNLTYRWSGSTYVEISPSIGLGTTSSTAFRGDYGNTAYQHAINKGSAFASGLYKITTNSEGHITSVTLVSKEDITNLGIPGQDTTYSFDGEYNASTNKAATVSSVNNAINGLNGGTIGTGGRSKTITSLSENAGNVSATFEDISITKSQVTDFPVLGDAAYKNVTDNTTATNVSSTDSNLITARTLYNAGYTKNQGTITEIIMNGESAGTSGAVDLGTVVTDISNKADQSDLTNHINDSVAHVTQQERALWNSKVTAYRNASGSLVLSYDLPPQ